MILVVYPGHGIFLPGSNLFFFVHLNQFQGEVLSSQTEEPSEKKVMHLYDSTRRMQGSTVMRLRPCMK